MDRKRQEDENLSENKIGNYKSEEMSDEALDKVVGGKLIYDLAREVLKWEENKNKNKNL